jgi:hypothetical protein
MDLAWLDWENVADELNHPRLSELQVSVDIEVVSGKVASQRDVQSGRPQYSCRDSRLLHATPNCVGKDRIVLSQL